MSLNYLMEFFNTNADESKNAAALQEYSNSLALGRDKQAKEDAKVEDYNSKLQSVLEPIGAKLTEEPAKDLIKGTVKGIARRVAKKGEDVVRQGVQKAADRLGVKPEDLVALRSRVEEGIRTLGKGASDIPTTARLQVEATSEPKVKLLRLGRGKLRDRVRVSRADKPVEESGFDVEDSITPTLARSTVTTDQGLLDQLAPLRAQFAKTKVLQDFRATQVIPEEQLLEAKPAPPVAKPDTQLEQGEEPPLGASLEDGAENEAGDVGKSIAKQATKKAIKTGIKDAVETGAEQFGEDVALGSEGGPAGTIIAGLVGLGTLLGGVFGGKHHESRPAMPINPSTNYGI
jgi:hypothetical protein